MCAYVHVYLELSRAAELIITQLHVTGSLVCRMWPTTCAVVVALPARCRYHVNAAAILQGAFEFRKVRGICDVLSVRTDVAQHRREITAADAIDRV